MAEPRPRPRRNGHFARLCDLAERHGLVVEIMENTAGERAIWVLLPERRDFDVAGVAATMRVGVVATPFMRDLPYDAASPRLISMLAARGYGEGEQS